MQRHKTVDDYILANQQWEEALTRLRKIFLSTELSEAVKWGAPVYTVDGKNVAGLGAFKSYVGIWFFQGMFLTDRHQKLINAQEGKTKAMRQWRFDSLEEIDTALVKEYLEEAIQNQKDGKELKPEKGKSLLIPDVLSEALEKNSNLKACFSELNLSKQREYAEYITEAKRDATKAKRLEKIIPMILDKIGLNDKYR